ncbi:Reactive oxygen species modulator 1 [Cynara cardunculus var. scolymus]|uniref:Reactive oxygen species modulator 1 n=2 Tax=Cynara cardunculus var. scolymus TaxID=59895 RepID=A0A118K4V8_CYNCS|nr:Reactive oxygen species modulator 1 [Cynara cardunculus var. scolymus]
MGWWCMATSGGRVGCGSDERHRGGAATTGMVRQRPARGRRWRRGVKQQQWCGDNKEKVTWRRQGDGDVETRGRRGVMILLASQINRERGGEREMARDSCLARVTAGVAVGGAVGGAVGAVYGTYDAIRNKVPGLLKIRYIGQATVGSAAIFGLFLGAGSLIHCGKSY